MGRLQSIPLDALPMRDAMLGSHRRQRRAGRRLEDQKGAKSSEARLRYSVMHSVMYSVLCATAVPKLCKKLAAESLAV